ncbi:MAG: SRPBCC family protein [Myxococcaceae bacterium]|nr:SRPBCC family protein [Myxococcaceae bacterium]MCI0672417.1 SRPBCC family protein [Myxococcaceae bacterium]
MPEIPRRPAELAAFLFRLDTPVSPRAYALTGFSLMALKYGVDALLVFVAMGRWWSPLAYVNPLLSQRLELERAPHWLLWTLLLGSLPFAWVGLSLTLRRVWDAGLHAAWALLFLVPGLNYLVMLSLCLLPTRERPARGSAPESAPVSGRMRSALLGVMAGALFALLMVAFSVYVLRAYGSALFVGTPVVMGVISGYALNRGTRHTVAATVGAATLTVVLAGGLTLLFALEGAICVAMAAPPAVVGSLLGALVGRALALRSGEPRVPGAEATLLLVLLPLLAGFEALPARRPLPVYEVASSVEIDAAPEQVWPHVIGFAELPRETEWVFQLGIASPRRARIEGSGVGAIRYCEFSTGPFVEPITHWEPPRRLSFDVTAQPAPMTEWSPYTNVHPPHLDGYLRSQRGEFRLVPLPGGRTRLEGSTWYTLDLGPAAYWRLWSDVLIGTIHGRVLRHVKALSEAPGR